MGYGYCVELALLKREMRMTYKNWAVEIHVNHKWVFVREHKEENIARRWFDENNCGGQITEIRLWNKNKLIDKKN